MYSFVPKEDVIIFHFDWKILVQIIIIINMFERVDINTNWTHVS